MATILLTWNPEKYSDARFRDYIVRNATGWTVGGTKQIQVGDRVFLIRQGNNCPGIVGSGTVIEAVHAVQNWEGAGTRPGITVNWEYLFSPDQVPPLSRNDLPSMPGIRPIWHSQMSGVRIPDDIAEIVREMWNNHLLAHQLVT